MRLFSIIRNTKFRKTRQIALSVDSGMIRFSDSGMSADCRQPALSGGLELTLVLRVARFQGESCVDQSRQSQYGQQGAHGAGGGGADVASVSGRVEPVDAPVPLTPRLRGPITDPLIPPLSPVANQRTSQHEQVSSRTAQRDPQSGERTVQTHFPGL